MKVKTRSQSLLFGICLLLLAGCAGKSRGVRMAIDLLRGTPFEPLSSTIEFTSFNAVGSAATAEGTVRTGFRFERQQGKWILKDVRLADRQWESVQELQEALNMVRRQRTQENLRALVAALENYRSQQGAYPAVSDVVSLVDALNPDYLDRVVRLDGWGHEIRI